MREGPIVVVVRQPGRRPLHVAVVDRVELGRDCDGVLITDPQASRRHLELTATASGVLATDLGSTNGTFGPSGRLQGPVLLDDATWLRLGDTTVALWRSDEPAVTGFDPRATSIDLVAASVERDHPDLAPLRGDSGTITVVFSDIEGSTDRTVALGDDAWYDVLAHHDRIVERRVAEHGGTVVKHQGDGFMLSFPSARAAVRAMVAVQRDLEGWAAEEPDRAVRVRVGAHVGEAVEEGGDLFGRAVIQAARIANAATGGQILVSGTVRELVEGRIEVPLGEGRPLELQGIGTRTVHEVIWA